MKKRFLMIMLFLSLVLFSLTSCSFTDEGALEITSITSELLPDGRTMMTITYSDEEIDPVIFYIPKGDSGNGIKDISYSGNADGTKTNVTISFTNEDMKDAVISIPNGVSIDKLQATKDSAGNTIVVIKYTDGSESEPIIIPKPEKGESGTTLTKYECNENADGSIVITFEFSDGSKYDCKIPAPKKGDDGKGIEAMVAETYENNYTIRVLFTDGTVEELSFDRTNKWLNGNVKPDNSLGVNGDYYFDIIQNTIYLKQNDNWIVVIDFNDDEQYYTVTFDLNDNTNTAILPSGYSKEYLIGKGQYFSESSSGYELPCPTRSGYEFGGWYTSKTPDVTNGCFTDLTPVFDNIKLYAKWIEL